MSFAFGVQAIQPVTGNPHILGFASTQVAADATLLDIWAGASAATRVTRINKDGQWLGVDGSGSQPTYSFEDQPSSGLRSAAASGREFVYLVGDGVSAIATNGHRVALGSRASSIGGSLFDFSHITLTGVFTPVDDSPGPRGVFVDVEVTTLASSTTTIEPTVFYVTGEISLANDIGGNGMASMMRLGGPQITLNGNTLSQSAALWIESVATEASTNYAILVEEGLVKFEGTLEVGTPPTYTPSNVTTDRSFDADTVNVAELADVVGTLIGDFQTMGLLD